MKETTKRSLIRWFHLTLTIPIIGYIYSPFELIPSYAFPTRFIFLPAMVLSGLWMWKGPWVRRLLARRPA
jgi:hypothetical protein